MSLTLFQTGHEMVQYQQTITMPIDLFEIGLVANIFK